MDNETFDMVDGILARQGYHDDRLAAEQILEVGVREGTLLDVAQVIAERYGLEVRVIVQWYAEVLNRQIQEAIDIMQRLSQMTI